ncbi:MAG: hypothetical protein LLF97_12795 [Planctomycetaceae bacterium]|nr:hypothetical protein [Planctomycetaceae bacterium]
MSTRERWIVYPLLFFAIGIALRDKILPQRVVRAREVFCDRLVSGRSECRALLVNGPKNRPVVVAGMDTSLRTGTVETFTEDGLPQVQLRSTESGGMVTAVGQAGKVVLILGYLGQNLGVFAQASGLAAPVSLTLPWRLEMKPQPPPQQTPPPTPSDSTPKKPKVSTTKT